MRKKLREKLYRMPIEQMTAGDLIMASEGPDSAEPRIIVDGDTPPEYSYDEKVAAARARSVLDRILKNQGIERPHDTLPPAA